MRIGFGYDVHAFAPGRPLRLGGIPVEHTQGLAGHSDADVLIHAICDALLGAAALRDIGHHFPDTDPALEHIDSTILLKQTLHLLRHAGYEVGNIDATIVAQQPRLSPHIPQMQQTLAQIMNIPPADISIKATTTEHLGFAGRSEGIATYAVALITRRPPHAGAPAD
jgi:2-C-methyl-D-erythritol 2,4-cyclodiphosphate synthase